MKKIFTAFIFCISSFSSFSQTSYIISGKISDKSNDKPIANATVHLFGSNLSVLSKIDGSFRFRISEWYDSLQITCIGFETNIIPLKKGKTQDLNIILNKNVEALDNVVVSIAKKPGKTFMQKVIDFKENNNPSRFQSFSYQRYSRHELDIDHIDYAKSKGKGLKSLLLQSYAALDSSVIDEKELPIYFSEELTNNYHSVSPKIDHENIIAKRNLGLRTDNMLSKLDKFYFNFNIYNDWLPVFDQTNVSPLNTNAFYYYKFFEGDKIPNELGDTLQQIRFLPQRQYERAFSGTLWINTLTLAVETINISISKTANLNFINNINYSQDYKQVYDSINDKLVYMPFKFISEVKFESGLDLLGIPVPENENTIKFIIRNTTVVDKIKLNSGEPANLMNALIKKEQTTNWEKSDNFWKQNRLDSLTPHEKNIYTMVDSLKENNRFQRDIKLVAFAGTGYWDFSDKLRIGSYSTFLSQNSIEGIRFRIGFWTMPGISKKFNVYGYGAYGTKDQKLKGLLGVKYVWNSARWTKSTLSYSSDYDYIIDQDDELDKDNIVNSLFRKKIPFSRTYIKQFTLFHEQYLSSNFSSKASLKYKELNPVFDFQYRPINPALDKPYDSVFKKMLPVAEASFGIRYAHHERTTILNYDNIKIGTFYPILFANYTYGFELAKAQFEFQKISLGIEQKLRLPPKMMLYYKLEGGTVLGTVPYLLLNIPAGNEYYVASKYQFNTMAPYEFASDKYVSLHTRFYLGGTILDNIPLLKKLGWRERLSFNAYWGSMNNANKEYNKHSNFNLIGKYPFLEASLGIENIFHIMSIEYYRRLNYLGNPYAKKDGIYLGITLSF